MPPLNLVGDFGGGALLSGGRRARRRCWRRQSPARDRWSMPRWCDGAASLMSMFFDMAAAGRWIEQREQQLPRRRRAFLRRL